MVFEMYDEDFNNVADDVRELYQMLQGHIEFFADEAMTVKINKENPLEIEWTEQEIMSEKKTDIYWRWHYEYPFTENELNSLTAEEKKELIKKYDLEDFQIGQNVTDMKFHFTFNIS